MLPIKQKRSNHDPKITNIQSALTLQGDSEGNTYIQINLDGTILKKGNVQTKIDALIVDKDENPLCSFNSLAAAVLKSWEDIITYYQLTELPKGIPENNQNT